MISVKTRLHVASLTGRRWNYPRASRFAVLLQAEVQRRHGRRVLSGRRFPHADERRPIRR